MGYKILDMIDTAMNDRGPFEDHPASNLSIENQLNYLNGLALVMGADNNIHEKECEYLELLIKSLELDSSVFVDVLAFSKAPDKDSIKALCKAFYNQPIAQTFIFDAYMLAFYDAEFKAVESQVIDKLAENMGIMKGTKEDIEDLFCHIKNKNWNESALYFCSFLLEVNSFKHLLSYYEVDYDDLLQRTDSLRKKRLKKIISSRSKSTYKSKVSVSKIITLPHAIVIPMLQAEINRGDCSS
jgi:uncharacterized tellurite resistance protein B-like protein